LKFQSEEQRLRKVVGISQLSMANYQALAETKENLQWASLVTLDLSEFDQPEGKTKLAAQLKEAIHKIGFFYIINHGLSQSDIDAQFELASSIFSLPLEEKMKYAVNPALPGGPLGYKAPGKRTVELYDDPKYNSIFRDRARPEPCVQNREQTERICRHLHYHVLYRLLVLVGIIMELEDEEALWKIHDYEKLNNCHMRYMCHWPPTQEQLEKAVRSGEVIAGHSDFGTFTMLFRQPIAGLQVRLEEEKEWKWVKPLDGSITVNVAVRIKSRNIQLHLILTVWQDTLSFLTGGYLKSSIHRVLLPPEDQRNIPRLSAIYFSRPG
jgi:isopenicillin N synthase-like dioxygenase